MEKANRLLSTIERLYRDDGISALPLEGVTVVRASAPTIPIHLVHEPAICVVLQGRKEMVVGDTVYRYGAGDLVLVAAEVPMSGRILDCSPEAPYLCLRIDLSLARLNEVIVETQSLTMISAPQEPILLSLMPDDVLDTITRLVTLVETERDIKFLAPLMEAELYYRLLKGPVGGHLRRIAHEGGKAHQVNRAIHWLKDNFMRPFCVKDMAGRLGMSVSTFHRHFRAVTGMSPLRYQKQIRLQEARKIMLTSAVDAAEAGFRVGYESPSQFNREYRRMFGAPPGRDIEAVKNCRWLTERTRPSLDKLEEARG